MDSSSDNGSDDSDDSDDSMDGGVGEKSSSVDGPEGLSEYANATVEWSQFMNSTEGILQYMDQATATIQGLPSLVTPSPSQEQKTQENASGEVHGQEQECSSPGVLVSPNSNKTQCEPTTLPGEVLARLSCANTTDLAVTTGLSTAASLADQLGPTTTELFAPNDSIHSNSSAPGRSSSMECRASMSIHANIKESDGMVVIAEIPAETAWPAASSCPPSSSGSPRRHAGLEPNPDNQISAQQPPSTVAAAGLMTSTPSNRSSIGDAPLQNTPLSLVDDGERNRLKKMGSKPEPLLASRVLESSRTSTLQQNLALLDNVKGVFPCFEGGEPVIVDVFSQIDVMASVGESEVARRIGREKARCVEARQQRRKDSITK